MLLLKMLKFVYILLFSLVLSINTVHGIKCYQCDSWDEPDCANGLKKLQPKECQNGEVSCITIVDTIMESIVRKCKSNSAKCLKVDTCIEETCHEDGCNINIACYECDTPNTPDCKDGGGIIEICPKGKTKCFIRYENSQILKQKCVGRSVHCGDQDYRTCKISEESFSNIPSVLSSNENLKCFQCKPEEDCNNVNIRQPISCRNYNKTDKCYTIGSSENSMTRGCLSDFDHKCYGETCVTCNSNGCNKQIFYRQPSRKCFQCGAIKKNCHQEPILCRNPVKYWTQKEECFIQISNKQIFQGCVNDRAIHETPCNNEYHCNTCNTDGCNIASDNDEDVSETDESESFFCVACFYTQKFINENLDNFKP